MAARLTSRRPPCAHNGMTDLRHVRSFDVKRGGSWTRPSTSGANLGHARSPPFTACVLGTAVDTRPVRLVVLGQLPLPRVHAQQASESLSHDRPFETSKCTAMRAQHSPLLNIGNALSSA